jgi:hypothetical protein
MLKSDVSGTYEEVGNVCGDLLPLDADFDSAVVGVDPDEIVVTTGAEPCPPDLGGLRNLGILNAHEVARVRNRMDIKIFRIIKNPCRIIRVATKQST